MRLGTDLPLGQWCHIAMVSGRRYAFLSQRRAGGAEWLRRQFCGYQRGRRQLPGQIQLERQCLLPRPARRGASVVRSPQRRGDQRRHAATFARRRKGAGGTVEFRCGRCGRSLVARPSRTIARRRPLRGSAFSGRRRGRQTVRGAGRRAQRGRRASAQSGRISDEGRNRVGQHGYECGRSLCAGDIWSG